MTWTYRRRSLFVVLAMAAQGAFLPAQSLEPIAANDNRAPAGQLRDSVLTLRLDLRKGVWHPEREDGEAIPVYAFGEVGKPLQVPGPLIRAPQGTTIEIALTNTLAVPVTIHGFHQRPGDDTDVVTVAAGASRQVRFAAGVPGTYCTGPERPTAGAGRTV